MWSVLTLHFWTLPWRGSRCCQDMLASLRFCSPHVKQEVLRAAHASRARAIDRSRPCPRWPSALRRATSRLTAVPQVSRSRGARGGWGHGWGPSLATEAAHNRGMRGGGTRAPSMSVVGTHTPTRLSIGESCDTHSQGDSGLVRAGGDLSRLRRRKSPGRTCVARPRTCRPSFLAGERSRKAVSGGSGVDVKVLARWAS